MQHVIIQVKIDILSSRVANICMYFWHQPLLLLLTTQCQHHVQCRAGCDLVEPECLVVIQLLATENKSNLLHMDAFLFFQ